MDDIMITDDILLKNGFEHNIYVSNLYTHKSYTLYIDNDSIKIDMIYKWTNNNANWYMHIDNDRCETIGSADIDYIWQFNLMMQIFNSNFKLNNI